MGKTNKIKGQRDWNLVQEGGSRAGKPDGLGKKFLNFTLIRSSGRNLFGWGKTHSPDCPSPYPPHLPQNLWHHTVHGSLNNIYMNIKCSVCRLYSRKRFDSWNLNKQPLLRIKIEIWPCESHSPTLLITYKSFNWSYLHPLQLSPTKSSDLLRVALPPVYLPTSPEPAWILSYCCQS